MLQSLIRPLIASSLLFAAASAGAASAPVPSDACPATPFVIPMGGRASVTGVTVNANDDFHSFCGDTSAATDAPDLVYAFTLLQPGTFTVEVDPLSAGFDPAVYLRTSCADDYACFDFGTGKETVQGAFTAGTYFFVVDGAAGTKGAFSLKASLQAASCGDGVVNAGEDCDPGGAVAGDGCGDPGTPDACKFEAPSVNADVCPGEPVSVPVGRTVLPGTTLGYANDYSSPHSIPPGGPDRVYAVTPQASGMMTVTIGLGADGVTDICETDQSSPGCWDRQIYARSACADGSPAAELDFSDIGAFDVEQLQFLVTAGSPVFVFVDGYDDQPYSSGTYDLIIDLQ